MQVCVDAHLTNPLDEAEGVARPAAVLSFEHGLDYRMHRQRIMRRHTACNVKGLCIGIRPKPVGKVLQGRRGLRCAVAIARSASSVPVAAVCIAAAWAALARMRFCRGKKFNGSGL